MFFLSTLIQTAQYSTTEHGPVENYHCKIIESNSYRLADTAKHQKNTPKVNCFALPTCSNRLSQDHLFTLCSGNAGGLYSPGKQLHGYFPGLKFRLHDTIYEGEVRKLHIKLLKHTRRANCEMKRCHTQQNTTAKYTIILSLTAV